MTPETAQKVRQVIRAVSVDDIRFLASKFGPRTLVWLRDCFNTPSLLSSQAKLLDEILETAGVESVGENLYLNAGDLYAPTLVHHNKHWQLQSQEWLMRIEVA